uniref:Uncharacterized protein n=1 Tax=candidate division WOR-3 bacterium TaxID=2052148 RepID=A0A7C4G9K3_UNCW3
MPRYLRLAACFVGVLAGALSAAPVGVSQPDPALLQTDLPRVEVYSPDGVPMFINYQGYLTDTLGTPITATLAMRFSIYADSSGGAPLWSRDLSSVSVIQGVFSVKLPLAAGDTSVFMGGQRRWLELRVGTWTLSPRTEITSMAYALRSVYCDNSDMLDGRHAHQFIYNGTSVQPSSNWWITGFGRAEGQLMAFGGVYGQFSDTGSFGVRGHNVHARGTGVAGSGSGDTLFFLRGGSGGAFSCRRIGLFAYAHDTTGTAIATMGNRISDSVYTLVQGSGGAFNGTTVGVYGLARNLTGDRCGGFFRNMGADTCFAYVAYRYSNTDHRVLGEGACTGTFDTPDGRRLLFSMESPLALVEDFGTGRLDGGHCRVDLDSRFLSGILVDAANPLRVFVTLNDNCNGVYVKTDGTGFDVYELQNGKSSAGFNWRAVAVRRGYQGMRMPAAPAALEHRALPVQSSPLHPAQQ